MSESHTDPWLVHDVYKQTVVRTVYERSTFITIASDILIRWVCYWPPSYIHFLQKQMMDDSLRYTSRRWLKWNIKRKKGKIAPAINSSDIVSNSAKQVQAEVALSTVNEAASLRPSSQDKTFRGKVHFHTLKLQKSWIQNHKKIKQGPVMLYNTVVHFPICYGVISQNLYCNFPRWFSSIKYFSVITCA